MAPRNQSLGARINGVLGGMLLLQNAPGVDTARDIISTGKGGHGTHKPRGVAPVDLRPLVDDWAGFFRRAAELAELELAMERGEVERPTHGRERGRSASVAKGRRRRIAREVLYQGRAPEFVAYIEDCTVQLVRDARREARLDPQTGERLERPTTAPANDQLRAYMTSGGRETA